jgi:hypothetical protein
LHLHIGFAERHRYRSEEYDTARDPGTPLSALSQVILGSMAKFMTDVGDISLEILDMISGRRCRKDSGRRDQDIQAESIAREILSSCGDHRTQLVDAPSLVTTACDPGSKWSDTRANAQGEKRSPSKFTHLPPKAAARIKRLAQGVMNIIVVPPMDITLTLSRGFHNMPLVFHDDTVRDLPKVTGMRSGLQAAGKVCVATTILFDPICSSHLIILQELVFGVYDGVTGLVALPHRGLKDSGAKGLIRGVGNGIGGFLSKPMAGSCIAPWSHLLKPCHCWKQIEVC